MWHIVGHEGPVALIKSSLASGNLPHAYLFVGPPNVGKATLALNLAQALNCVQSEPPCGQCPACLRTAKRSHSDVMSLGIERAEREGRSAKFEIGIDEIKEIQRVVSLPPFEGKYKVFMIDGAEYLSPEAANRLLKTLEEPPSYVIFILLATDEERLMPTIVSRCQRVELKPVPLKHIKEVLIETYSVEPGRADLLSRLSLGCPGWAIRALTDDAWAEERSRAVGQIMTLLGGSREERFHVAADLATLFDRDRQSGENVIKLWLMWWRDLLLLKGGNSETVTNIDYLPTLSEAAEKLTLEQIKEFILGMEKTMKQVYQNVNARLALECLMLDIPQ